MKLNAEEIKAKFIEIHLEIAREEDLKIHDTYNCQLCSFAEDIVIEIENPPFNKLINECNYCTYHRVSNVGGYCMDQLTSKNGFNKPMRAEFNKRVANALRYYKAEHFITPPGDKPRFPIIIEIDKQVYKEYTDD